MKCLTGMSMALLMGCGQFQDLPVKGINSTLQPIVNSFKSEAKAFGLGEGQDLWAANFGILSDPSWWGQCGISWGKDDLGNPIQIRVITIKSDLDSEWIPSVMRHELGHCVYDLPDRYDDGYAGELMYSRSTNLPTEIELKELTWRAFALVIQSQVF